jgi:hypothetical protein
VSQFRRHPPKIGFTSTIEFAGKPCADFAFVPLGYTDDKRYLVVRLVYASPNLSELTAGLGSEWEILKVH